MFKRLLHKTQYLVNRVRFFYVPPSPVGVAVMFPIGGPSDLGIEFVNDDRTHMEFAVRVLQCCFAMSRREAILSMVKIHTEGRAMIGFTDREKAEQLVAHVTRVARRRGFPLEVRLVAAV